MTELTQKYINNLNKNLYSEIPTTLNVELTNKCNLNCVMCPTQNSKRDKGWMDLSLFKKILNESVDMGVKQVGLFTVGESILHPKIDKFISISKQRDVYTYLDTNGNHIRDDMYERIIDAGLDSLKFSIDAHCQDIYKQIRKGGHFNNVLNNLIKFDNLRKKKKSSLRLYAYYLINSINEKYIAEFINVVGPYVDEIEFFVVLNHGISESYYQTLFPKRYKSIMIKHKNEVCCPNPWKRIVLSWDGYLTACCIDFELSLSYGQYESGRLNASWNNDRATFIRNCMRDRNFDNIPICKQCDNVKYDVSSIALDINNQVINEYKLDFERVGKKKISQ